MKKILIIDDEEKPRNLLACIIKLEGFAITESGKIRLTISRVNTATIIHDAIQAVMSSAAEKEISVVNYSANSLTRHRSRC